MLLKGLYHDFNQTYITFYSVSVLTTVFKRFHDKIKVVFYVRRSVQRIQYWECKQILGHVIVYKISRNERTPWYILDLDLDLDLDLPGSRPLLVDC
jgi:hypothetical protein